MTRPAGRASPRRLSIHPPKLSIAVAVLLAALGVGACAQQSRTPAATPGKTAAWAPVKPDAAAPAVPLAVPLAPKVYPPPSHLAGLYGEQVIGLLGSPGFKRKDDPALIWQYRTKACALDLFLYRAGDGTPYTVQHFETRSRGKETISASDCFVSLLKAMERKRQG